MKDQGESDKFYINDHHEPIVSKEQWDHVNKILSARLNCRKLNSDGTRVRFSRQYTFSSICECGFCGRILTRRVWRNGKVYEKEIWQCMSYSKHGKSKCPNSKGIPENVLEDSFIEAYNRLIGGNDSSLNDFIEKTSSYIKNSNVKGLIEACEEKMEENQEKIDKLALAFVDGTLSQDVYESKLRFLNAEKARLAKEKEDLDLRAMSESDALSKLSEFRNAAIESGGKKLSNFSKDIFDTTIDRIIVGGYDENKKVNPFMLTFVFMKEFGSSDIIESKKNYTIIDGFTHYWIHVVFKPQGDKERAKVQGNFIKVKIAISN